MFNLVNGLGPDVGAVLSAHLGLDMISFTGSARAGIDVARRAAPTIKRVSQELGSKSATIVLGDADLEKAVGGGAAHCFQNSGQSCNAPTRMLVPLARMEEAAAIAKAVAEKTTPGRSEGGGHRDRPPRQPDAMGESPGANRRHPGRRHTCRPLSRAPAGPEQGYYARPTVFANVANDMTIAREEIFGPVLSIAGYKDEEDAIRIANYTPYGLAGYVSSGDIAHARRMLPPHPRGQCELTRPQRAGGAFWRLQAVGQWPRMGPLRPGGVFGGQGRCRAG